MLLSFRSHWENTGYGCNCAHVVVTVMSGATAVMWMTVTVITCVARDHFQQRLVMSCPYSPDLLFRPGVLLRGSRRSRTQHRSRRALNLRWGQKFSRELSVRLPQVIFQLWTVACVAALETLRCVRITVMNLNLKKRIKIKEKYNIIIIIINNTTDNNAFLVCNIAP